MPSREQLKKAAKANLVAMRRSGQSRDEMERLIAVRLEEAFRDVDNAEKALRRAQDRQRTWEWTRDALYFGD